MIAYRTENPSSGRYSVIAIVIAYRTENPSSGRYSVIAIVIAYRTENHRFDPWLGQTKAKKTPSICSFPAIHTAWRSKKRTVIIRRISGERYPSVDCIKI